MPFQADEVALCDVFCRQAWVKSTKISFVPTKEVLVTATDDVLESNGR